MLLSTLKAQERLGVAVYAKRRQEDVQSAKPNWPVSDPRRPCPNKVSSGGMTEVGLLFTHACMHVDLDTCAPHAPTPTPVHTTHGFNLRRDTSVAAAFN